MSRFSRVLLVLIVILFLLACDFVTQPFNDVKNIAGTAQSIATAIPIQTLEALPSAIPSFIPEQTLEALPSVMPTFEAVATDIGSVLNPQGPPVPDWKGIPVMSQATAGQEFTENNTNIYSFKANATEQEAQEFYKQKLPALGWNQPGVPGAGDAGILVFQKENNSLVVTILPSENSVVVILALGASS
jgi:hypothetical protein